MHFFIIPTYDCNISCSYCFEKEDRKNIKSCRNIIDVRNPKIEQDFIKYFEYVKKNNIKKECGISFHGGETTLLPADDFLYLCHLWKKCYEKTFETTIKKMYASIITNGIRFIREPEYLEKIASDEEIFLSLGISFDMYSQSERSPETYSDFENLFKTLNSEKYNKKIRFGLLTQISKHSIENGKEWLKYFEYFNNNFYYDIDNIRLKLIDDYSFNIKDLKKSYLSKNKTYKFLKKIRNLQNKIALETGKVIPTGYFERYFDLDENICFGTCGNDLNLCWSFREDNANMFHYYNYNFVMGCPRVSNVDEGLVFNDFEDGLKNAISFFNKKYTYEQNKKCNGCKYRPVCQPCPILPTNEKMYFNNECKVFMKRILKK